VGPHADRRRSPDPRGPRRPGPRRHPPQGRKPGWRPFGLGPGLDRTPGEASNAVLSGDLAPCPTSPRSRRATRGSPPPRRTGPNRGHAGEPRLGLAASVRRVLRDAEILRQGASFVRGGDTLAGLSSILDEFRNRTLTGFRTTAVRDFARMGSGPGAVDEAWRPRPRVSGAAGGPTAGPGKTPRAEWRPRVPRTVAEAGPTTAACYCSRRHSGRQRARPWSPTPPGPRSDGPRRMSWLGRFGSSTSRRGGRRSPKRRHRTGSVRSIPPSSSLSPSRYRRLGLAPQDRRSGPREARP